MLQQTETTLLSPSHVYRDARTYRDTRAYSPASRDDQTDGGNS